MQIMVSIIKFSLKLIEWGFNKKKYRLVISDWLGLRNFQKNSKADITIKNNYNNNNVKKSDM